MLSLHLLSTPPSEAIRLARDRERTTLLTLRWGITRTLQEPDLSYRRCRI
jgi:hypothetical protein